MRRRRLLVGLIAPAALVALVGALATLQYRWVGQVSEAEREQMRESLARRVGEFAGDFDREIGRIFQQFQQDTSPLEPAAATRFAQKYGQWKSGARFPDLVRAIYFAPSVASGVDLYRYSPERLVFEPAGWPASLEPVRSRLATVERAMPPVSGAKGVFTFRSSPVMSDVPAILIPLIEPVDRDLNPPSSGPTFDMLVALHLSRSQLIVELDNTVLKETMLPQIASRHFPDTGSDAYRVSIVDAKAQSILTRGLAPGQAIDPEHADATQPFFTVGLEQLRDTAVSWSSVRGAAESAGGRRSGGVATVTPLGKSSQFSVLLEQRAVTTGPASTTAIRVTTPGSWKILVQHAAGSVDAAVAAVRRRNLWLSFGILAVLATSVGLIVTNARRSERLAAQQMDFVATVSHELRTPLAVIRSAAQNLSAGVVHDGAQARRYGDLIEGEGRRLTDMVEQVLEYAGLSGNRRPAMAGPVDVSTLVNDVAASCGTLAEADHITVEVDAPTDLPAVVADEGALRRALHNLVTNALKYAAEGRWVGLGARKAAGRSGDEVQISVSDRGRGITSDDLPHLFEPFYRGRYAIERQIHGNGLGLSLVKRIVEAHGGRVTVTSTPGSGSTFTLHLPAAPAETAATPLGDPAADTAGPSA
jgi:signal transduction histidine kinase